MLLHSNTKRQTSQKDRPAEIMSADQGTIDQGTIDLGTVTVNMTTYYRDYVKRSIDNARKAKDMKEASEELQKAFKVLLLYPNHKFSKLQLAIKHEAKGDAHFEQKKFKDAYESYDKAIDALKTRQFSKTRFLLALMVGIPGLIDIYGQKLPQETEWRAFDYLMCRCKWG